MPKFELENYDVIKGNRKFYKLVKDFDCMYDQFCDQIESEGNLISELKTIISIMQLVADGQPLPDNKFKNITPQKSSCKEYEVKTRNLRVYLIHQENTGKIIICGGKKNSQRSDIKLFRSLKKQYLDYINYK